MEVRDRGGGRSIPVLEPDRGSPSILPGKDMGPEVRGCCLLP